MPSPLDYLKQAQARIGQGVTPDPSIQAAINNPEGHLLGALPVPEGLLEGALSKMGRFGSSLLSKVAPRASSALQGLSEAAPAAAEGVETTPGPFGDPGPYRADVPIKQQAAEYNALRDAKMRGLPGDVPSGAGAQQLEAARRSLQGAAPTSTPSLTPIQQFYAQDPQARIGGDARTTGSFVEGSGGLSDVAAGNIKRYPMPPSTTTPGGR